MTSFFRGIETLFVDYLFAPYDILRGLDSWWLANIVNWLLFVIGAVAFVYWMLQLKNFNDNNEEDKSITSHSYL
jgi:hypothetical protein